MKNTMKIKSLLSFFVPAALMALSVASCSDYDNGYTESAIKFQEAFKETFGDIDPEQDWNMAERATVTVNTGRESNIKIYALSGDSYSIVGNYQGVIGQRELGVDVIEGTRSLLVTDGRTAQKCTPGDKVDFNSMSTRTVHEGTTSIGNNQSITVTKMWSDINNLGDGVNHPAYRTSTNEEITGMLRTIPQGENNLSKDGVHNDFTYLSTGSFIIYPFYWYTASRNIIGLYYIDDYGVEQRIPIITPNDVGGSTELWYKEGSQTDTNSDTPMKTDGWTRSGENSGVGEFKAQTNSQNTEYDDDSGVNAKDGNAFLEVWTNWDKSLGTQSFSKTFTNFEANAEYRVEVKARLVDQEAGKGTISSNDNVALKANGVSVNMTYQSTCVKTTKTSNGNTWGMAYPNMGGQNKMWVICKADGNGNIKVSLDLINVQANWFSFKDLVFHKLNNNSLREEEARGHEYFSTDGGVRGQGILVEIPEGKTFGMYLEKTDVTGHYIIHSEGKLNERNEGLVGSWNAQTGSYQFPSCYTSTFRVGDQMFIGFEDWPGAHSGDYDLNDMVFTFYGNQPVIIDEEPTNTWMLACEDLGGTFDTDYNDVIFKVKHVSGESTATVTPIAAGGTLASYIFYVPRSGSEQCLGEIHQLFGFQPAESGKYEAHNVVIGEMYEEDSEGTSCTITVPEDWSMAYYSTDTYGLPQQGGADAGWQNMGGFEIRTLPKGTPAISNAEANWSNITALSSGASRIPAPDLGEAPYIICIPYSYVELNKPSKGQKTETFWAWPGEYVHIESCYQDFPKWVSDHRYYGEWYKNRQERASTVHERTVVTSNGNPVLLPSQLGHTLETINVVKNSGPDSKGSYYYDVNNYADLYANLTGQISGVALHYYYLDGSEEKPLEQYHHLYNEGDRTIVVRQDATGTHDAGRTQFTLHISAAQTTGTQDPPLGTQGQTESTYLWNDGNNHEYNLHSGEVMTIRPYINDGRATNAITMSFNDGGTGSTYTASSNTDLKNGNVVITGGTTAGTATLTLHYPGDATFKAKDITITVNIAPKADAEFKTRGQYATGSNQQIWDWGTGGYTFTSLSTGDKIKIETSLPNDATGEITARLDEKNGSTGSILSVATEDGKKVFYFTAGGTRGTEVYIRISYAGDSKYNPANTNVRIKTVSAARVVRFTYWDNATWALTHGGNGNLQLQTSNDGNVYQMWRLEPHGNDGQHDLYALFNLGARKYLRIQSANDGHGVFESNFDNGNTPIYLFEIVDNNDKHNCLRVREFCRNGVGKYMGIEQAPQENLSVFLDKEYYNQWIPWQINDVYPSNISNAAKLRRVNKK